MGASCAFASRQPRRRPPPRRRSARAPRSRTPLAHAPSLLPPGCVSLARARAPSRSDRALKYDVTVLQKKIETAAARAEAFGAELREQQAAVASLRERAEQCETDTRELAEVLQMLSASALSASSNTDVARQLAPMRAKLDDAEAKRGALRSEWSVQSRRSAVRLRLRRRASYISRCPARSTAAPHLPLFQPLTLVRCASFPSFRRSVRLSTFAGHSHQQVLQTEFDEASERKNALSTQLVHMVQINEVEKREALRRVVEGDGQP